VQLPQLRRIRWAVRATLLLGVAASVLANILHALDNPISQAIAAWPPVALLLTVELISRVPVHRRVLAASRLIATAIIAGIAAWVSYWHMAGVAARYGETGASPYLLPLSVDGLIVVASICLVELGGRIATLEQPATAPAAEPATVPVAPVPATSSHQATAALSQPVTAAASEPVTAASRPVTAAASQPVTAASRPVTAAASQPLTVADSQLIADAAPYSTAGTEAFQPTAAAPTDQPGDEVSHIMVDALPEEPARVQTPDPGLIRAAAARTGANPVVAGRAGSSQHGSARTESARVAQGVSPEPTPAQSVEMPSPLRRSTAAALAEAATALPRSTTGFNPTVTRAGHAQHLSRSAGAPTGSRSAGGPPSSRSANAPGGSRSANAPGGSRGTADARSGSRSAPAQRHAGSSGKNAPAARPRRTPAETVALAARIKAEQPTITEAELAAELGISPSRWRSVRREAGQTADRELAA
jgi:hypothetical protein